MTGPEHVRPDETPPGGQQELMAQLKRLFADMDAAYRETAGTRGFTCESCADTCCRSIFHHHTLLENLLIAEGLRGLSSAERDSLAIRAEDIRKRQAAGGRAPCPLLDGTRCSLYAHRPMICRLHGVPHEHRHPSKGRIRGEGCHRFAAEDSGTDAPVLDRTALYERLAALEREMRRVKRVSRVPKRTIAEMILEVLQ